MTIRLKDPQKKRAQKPSIRTFLTNTRFLTLGLSFIGAVIMFGGFVLGNIAFHQNVSDAYLGMIMALSLPWIMLSCVIIIVRREIPRFGLPSIKGKAAILQGSFCLLILVIAEVYIIYLLLYSA